MEKYYDSVKYQVTPRGMEPTSLALFVLFFVPGLILGIFQHKPFIVITFFLVAVLVSSAVKISRQWEKAVVLRLGKFQKLFGPGLFFIIPLIDTVICWVDQRIISTPFNIKQTLTKDTVPVDVNAILFWMVWDAKKAALEVENYKDSVVWAAQSALRDMIGKSQFSEMLTGRDYIDEELGKIINRRTEPWGVSVQSVEICDVIIPKYLQDVMSREAQAEGERKARIILGIAETEIAARFAEAAKSYENNPVAMHLRDMNILYEGFKEKGALVVVPSSVVETMGLDTITGLASMAKYPSAYKVSSKSK